MHRFYCPQLVETGTVTLVETEAHHLAHVLRHQPGDIVELFRGDGLVARCCVEQVRKRDVQLQVQTSQQEPQSNTSLTLATAVPKGDRFDWMVEKCTELGVARLIPFTTSRSVVDPRDTKLDKLRQKVIAACKQSRRNVLMEICPVVSWGDFARQLSADEVVLIAHPDGEPLAATLATVANGQTRPLIVAIGPEGGFSEEEILLAVQSGARKIQLGTNILRIETAAVALAARLLL